MPTCSHCDNPITARNTTGLCQRTPRCRALAQVVWRSRHKTGIAIAESARYGRNKQRIALRQRGYYARNKSKINVQHRAWRADNPDKVSAQNRRAYLRRKVDK